ncbi:MAG: acyltransferase [Acetobacteraceae bacterium]|nr:acyltransferase [Acetobacteraceae bacterium]
MRYTSLDAVRGIASFMVLTHHCFLAGLLPIPAGFWTSVSRYTPLHLFLSGRPAVILFFVLSGFVLAVSIEKSEPGYAAFAVRRLCRIYLPYAFVVLLSAAAYWSSPEPPLPSQSWAAQTWSEPADPGLVLGHLLMPFAGANLTLDRSAWSLIHEIRISLAIPLLSLAVARMPWISIGAALALAIAGWRWTGCSDLACLPYNGADTDVSFGATAYFVIFFLLGILLARQRERVAAWLRRGSRLCAGTLWATALYGMIVPFKFNKLPDAPIALSALLLLGLTLGSPRIGGVLEKPVLQWLGRISFSLYLIHSVVLAGILRWGWGQEPRLLLAATIGLSLASADLLYRFVERPSLRFGHRAAAWLARPPMGESPRDMRRQTA